MMGNGLKKGHNSKFQDNCGLVLYHHPHSFYSQKVIFALHEKNIKFTAYEVDVSNSEQYSEWFLELNSKGEVPVLQHDALVVPASGRIISYLEDNFQGENIRRLLPKDVNVKVLERVIYFHRKISRLPIGAISMGSFIHSDLCSNPKVPFIGPVRAGFLQADEQISCVLEHHAKLNPAYGEALLSKARFQEQKRAVIKDRKEYMRLIEAADEVLADVEQQLKNVEGIKNVWLCSEEFTIADISLGILLHRLYSLGFENLFWANDKRPLIEKYFERLCERESFKKSLPNTISTIKTVWSKTPSIYKLGVGSLSAAILLTSFIAHRI